MEPPYRSGDIINDKYRLISILGQGGTAITYEAEDITLNESVAIKVLSLHQSQEWKVIELFEREAKVLANLHHPRIPKYYDYFYLDLEQDRHFFIVQELIVGNSLKTLLDRGWHFQEAEVKEIAQQVLEILNYLHSLKPSVIHRDIKPHNLIKTDAGEIYLVDFGSVQDVYRNTITRGATFVGTFDYMSPEQIRGQTSFASDLYSLGCTLLYLLTKRSPSELPLERMKINFRQKLKLSESFADWLDTILEPVPEDRFQSTAEALSSLEQNQFKIKLYAVPIDGSKIKLYKNQDKLLILIPAAGIKFYSILEIFMFLLGVYFIIPLIIMMAKVNGRSLDYLIASHPLHFLSPLYLVGLLILLSPIIINLLLDFFVKTSLEIDSNRTAIQWEIWKIQRKKIIKTQEIIKIKLQRENSGLNMNKVMTYCLIQDINHEYKIGKYSTATENQWLVTEIRSFIDRLYPEKNLSLRKSNNEWSNNLFDV